MKHIPTRTAGGATELDAATGLLLGGPQDLVSAFGNGSGAPAATDGSWNALSDAVPSDSDSHPVANGGNVALTSLPVFGASLAASDISAFLSAPQSDSFGSFLFGGNSSVDAGYDHTAGALFGDQPHDGDFSAPATVGSGSEPVDLVAATPLTFASATTTSGSSFASHPIGAFSIPVSLDSPAGFTPNWSEASAGLSASSHFDHAVTGGGNSINAGGFTAPVTAPTSGFSLPFLDEELPVVGGSAAIVSSVSSSSSSSQTVTLAGSGLVFNNTFGSGASATFISEVDAAENYLQSQFGNACVVNCNFDIQSINPNYSGENSFDPIVVSYSTFVNALKSHAETPTAVAAAAALTTLADPSHGAGFEVSIGEARILGLAGPGSGTDDSIILNSVYWTASALQNHPGDAEGTLEHELSEGIMGRIGSLGIADAPYLAPMDLFRFTASGQRDFTGGQDGQPTYFSVNGSTVYTGLQYHNSVNSSDQFDGYDLADWDQVGADANAHDPFGPGGPGAGDPGTLSATDILVMEALGWAPPSSGSITVAATSADAVQGFSAVLLLTGAPAITDTASSTLASATIEITNAGGNPVSGDELFINGVQSGAVGDGVTASWNAVTDTLTLTGVTTIANYQSLLAEITYQDTGVDSSTGSHPLRTITWSVNDGTNSFDVPSQITIDRAPVVTASNVTLGAGQTSVAASSLFTASDADGDTIKLYALYDSSPGAGHFEVNGVAEPAYQVFYLTPAQLAETEFVAGSGGASGASYQLYVGAYDGTAWNTPWTEFQVNVAASQSPVVTAANESVASGATIAASSMFSVSDPAGQPIELYALYDSSPGAGHFEVNGVAEPAYQVFYLTPAQLAETEFVAGSGGASGASYQLYVGAYDGTAWNTPWTEFQVNVAASPPVVTAANESVASGATIAASSMFSVSDPAGQPIELYALYDSSPGAGHFEVNGVAEPAYQVFYLTPAQLAETEFVAGSGGASGASYQLYVGAYDGTAWNTPWTEFQVNVTASTSSLQYKGFDYVAFYNGAYHTQSSIAGSASVAPHGLTSAPLFGHDWNSSSISGDIATAAQSGTDIVSPLGGTTFNGWTRGANHVAIDIVNATTTVNGGPLFVDTSTTTAATNAGTPGIASVSLHGLTSSTLAGDDSNSEAANEPSLKQNLADHTFSFTSDSIGNYTASVSTQNDGSVESLAFNAVTTTSGQDSIASDVDANFVTDTTMQSPDGTVASGQLSGTNSSSMQSAATVVGGFGTDSFAFKPGLGGDTVAQAASSNAMEQAGLSSTTNVDQFHAHFNEAQAGQAQSPIQTAVASHDPLNLGNHDSSALATVQVPDPHAWILAAHHL